MRLIDADALVEAIKDYPYGFRGMIVCDIAKQPTIEPLPVTRCKDCKNRPIDTGGHNYGQDLFFPDEDKCPCQCGDHWYSWMPGDDWFCANGERSEECG